MFDCDLEYLEDELEDIDLILALKMIELRIYNDISYEEEEMDTIKEDIDFYGNKEKVFLSKIRWFRDWINRKNINLVEAGLTDLDKMGIDDVLNAVIINDSAGFKRRKIYNEVTGMPIYVVDDELICEENEYANEYYIEEMKYRLRIN